jgi:transglutaminase-like putative cysteine protease
MPACVLVRWWHNTRRMTILHVTHTTTYRYRRPVELGEHRLMCRPRDSHDLRLIDTTLYIRPTAQSVRWMHDVFGNSIAIVSFANEPANEVIFESAFRAEHYPSPPQAISVEPNALRLPFSYSEDDWKDLGQTATRAYPDPEHKIDAWAHAIVDATPDHRTLDTLIAMSSAIKQRFSYVAREEAGVQSPLATLESESGSCRDFAVLMIEAARSLGLAARFVSGYLYDERLIDAGAPDKNSRSLVGGGATHAWVQIYLPGAGWVEFDPTNALVGGENLIRVAVARDSWQAAPLVGTFVGTAEDFESMVVDVTVSAE